MKIQLTKIKTSRHLSLSGWLLVAGSFALLVYIWVHTIHDFLAQNKPTHASILVIEGHVPDFVLDSVVNLYKRDTSLIIVCAGLPFKKGYFCIEYSDQAEYNAALLRSKGVDTKKIALASAQPTDKDRTYTTALAAKKKLKSLGYTSGKIDVVCLGTHARRSLLLYRKAFKSEWNVGVITYSDDEYPEQWWRTSEGARAVMYEMFAYLYCAIFFHP